MDEEEMDLSHGIEYKENENKKMGKVGTEKR